MRAVDFLFGQLDQAFEVAQVTVLQQRVEQHRAKRGRERQREARVHAVAQPAVHDLNQRDVSLGDGLEEPVFLEKLFVLRMAHERQMRVEDEREIALHEPKFKKGFGPVAFSPRELRGYSSRYSSMARASAEAHYQYRDPDHKRNGQIKAAPETDVRGDRWRHLNQ